MKNELKPKTNNHYSYVRAIAENDYVLVEGPAGSGKSFIATGMACQYLEEGKIERIVVTRPMIQAGRETIGYLKGTLEDKVFPFMMPIFDHLSFFLGKEKMESLRMDGTITILPLELARGMNLYRSFVIGDEFNNADKEQIKMILTRINKGSKIVLNGDIKQSDICYENEDCDFKWCIEKLKGLDGVEIVKLTNQDIMRHGMISKILKRLE